jgi:hypothetical protein
LCLFIWIGLVGFNLSRIEWHSRIHSNRVWKQSGAEFNQLEPNEPLIVSQVPHNNTTCLKTRNSNFTNTWDQNVAQVEATQPKSASFPVGCLFWTKW